MPWPPAWLQTARPSPRRLWRLARRGGRRQPPALVTQRIGASEGRGRVRGRRLRGEARRSGRSGSSRSTRRATSTPPTRRSAYAARRSPPDEVAFVHQDARVTHARRSRSISLGAQPRSRPADQPCVTIRSRDRARARRTARPRRHRLRGRLWRTRSGELSTGYRHDLPPAKLGDFPPHPARPAASSRRGAAGGRRGLHGLPDGCATRSSRR